ncbi:ABC transporter substrate-binding protein [Urechidicola croceus]|uniref:ABC transporter substrate-binding protein n=2 Tax=Urechidicola croceus TaxID=1850246 RepID=A0A1D8P530_9FLAO|nr:ABC transporter substrate-binding protein [Urechidicola croceus]
MKIYRIITLFSLFILMQSCKNDSMSNNSITKTKTSIKHAKGFDIELVKNINKLTIKSPYPESTIFYEYYLVGVNDDASKIPIGSKIIKTPIERIVVTSTTHIPMLELLEVEKSLVGFPNMEYVSSKKTRNLIDTGKVQELGMDANLNTEILIDLNPDAVIGFSINGANSSFSTIERANIPVIYNGDWLEESPLGRAEWIKFFGILFNKEKMADSIFKSIEKNYLEAKEIATNSTIKPTVLSGIMFKDVWNLPSGESFVARLLQDANTDFLWKDTKGKGSLYLNFESVLEKAQHADLWIAPGYFSTKKEMIQASKLYTQFDAFNNNTIYIFSNKKGSTGGVIYYELAPTRPDLVLKDLIKIAHPTLLSDYELSFFEKMN